MPMGVNSVSIVYAVSPGCRMIPRPHFTAIGLNDNVRSGLTIEPTGYSYLTKKPLGTLDATVASGISSMRVSLWKKTQLPLKFPTRNSGLTGIISEDDWI